MQRQKKNEAPLFGLKPEVSQMKYLSGHILSPWSHYRSTKDFARQKHKVLNSRPRKYKKLIIGVTGIFGSGKSTVSRIFKSYGAKIIDADKIAHRCLLPGAKSYKRIVSSFGKGIIFKARRKINRHKLGRLVFGNRRLLKKLNSIIHPKVISDIKESIRKSEAKVIVLDAPLLLEAGLKKMVDDLIVVIIDRDELIRRLMKKASLKRPDILKRINAQISQNIKSRFANFIIDNSGAVSDTKKQVKKIWKSLAPRSR
ncbi:MAG: dephospho-CoA kinase [Candidatus Omnitrophica bacterium CG08_land_8_20_14_0_20_41_16]|uniref:Dephospho-CoA kinase n=1 Tax=Candidatus Sherwoodlollariibacterium unditelluris TaxID=1974757 RepID=A0A2G9YL52_9BACT|nr:MAG: dephospho-CoA kinase [Candidatus Omnitrophica bacterium CG23_combo_of_CG06-09_8_20_14_all_41_10]PIS34023.1 MAG: dephospho-CoA kinase [Candidatus Omnitrophica bacterium CG08_land_8_20_14_0_20_41_16]